MLFGSFTTPSGIRAASLSCATWACGDFSLWWHLVSVLFGFKFTDCTSASEGEHKTVVWSIATAFVFMAYQMFFVLLSRFARSGF
jgi:hypothetical protein